MPVFIGDERSLVTLFVTQYGILVMDSVTTGDQGSIGIPSSSVCSERPGTCFTIHRSRSNA